MDENGQERPEQLSMAAGGECYIEMFPADLREARVRGDLPMAQLYETGGHASGQHGDGQHNDAVREDREAAWQNPRLPRSGLHHGRQVRLVGVRARGSDLSGRQGPRRRLPVPFAAGETYPASTLDQNTERSAQLPERKRGGRCERFKLVPQAIQGHGQGAILQEHEHGNVLSFHDSGLLFRNLGRWQTEAFQVHRDTETSVSTMLR